jgi:hypothetical protein
MGILDKHQKSNIRYSNKDITFFEPTDEQLREVKEIIENNITNINEIKTNQELDIKSIRFIIREITNIGAEIDGYTDEDLVNKLNNGDRILKLLLREVQKFVNETIDDIFEEKIEQTKGINTLLNIANSKQDLETMKIKMNKFFKKNKINIKFEDFVKIQNNPQLIEDLINKLNVKTK